MIMTMKMGMRTQSRRAGSRKSDCVDPVMVVMVAAKDQRQIPINC